MSTHVYDEWWAGLMSRVADEEERVVLGRLLLLALEGAPHDEEEVLKLIKWVARSAYKWKYMS